jgi:hypothetical protein
MAFATVADLEARWRPLTTEEESRASVLLDDAAVYLSALVTVDPTDEEQAAVLKTVSCSMVQRVMSADVDTYGLSQTSMTAGSYTQSMTFANPSGDFYLTGFEKVMLGISGSRIGTIRPKAAFDD